MDKVNGTTHFSVGASETETQDKLLSHRIFERVAHSI